MKCENNILYNARAILFVIGIYFLIILLFTPSAHAVQSSSSIPLDFQIGNTSGQAQLQIGWYFNITDSSGRSNSAQPALIQAAFIPADDPLRTLLRGGCTMIGTLFSGLMQSMSSTGGGANPLANLGQMAGGGGKAGQVMQMIGPLLQQGMQQSQQMTGALMGAMSEGFPVICNALIDFGGGRTNTIHIQTQCISNELSTRGRNNFPLTEVITSEGDVNGAQGVNVAVYDLIEHNFCSCEGDYNITAWVDTPLDLPRTSRQNNPSRQNLSINYDASQYYCTMPGCGSVDEGVLSTWDEKGIRNLGGNCCGDDETDDPDMGKNACLNCPIGLYAPQWDENRNEIAPRSKDRRDWSDEPIFNDNDNPNQCCGDDRMDCGFVVAGEGKVCISSEVRVAGTSRRSTRTKTQFEWIGGIENYEDVDEFGDDPTFIDSGKVFNVSCLGYPILLAGEEVIGCNSESRIKLNPTGNEYLALSGNLKRKTFNGILFGQEAPNPFEFQGRHYLCHQHEEGEYRIGICCSTGSCPSTSDGGTRFSIGQSIRQQGPNAAYTFYCTSNNNFTRNLDDEIYGKATCEAAKNPDGTLSNLRWTGSYCCGEGDDGLETYNDPPKETIITGSPNSVAVPGGYQDFGTYDAFTGGTPGPLQTQRTILPGTDPTMSTIETTGACFLSRYQPDRQFLVETITRPGRLTLHRGTVILDGTMHGCAIDQFDLKADGVSMTDNKRFRPLRTEHKPYNEGLPVSNDWILNYPDAPDRKVVNAYAVKDHPYCDRIGPDDAKKLFCSYNETWVLDESATGRTHLSYIEWEPADDLAPVQHAECCMETQCWNGSACIGDFTATPQAQGYGGDHYENWRCYDGEWTLSTRKYTYDGQASGFCSNSSHCLYDPTGDNSAAHPICVPDGWYTMDHYCDDGYWTTRTKLLAGAMLNSIPVTERYTLYCDTYTNTANTFTYLVESGNVSAYFADSGPDAPAFTPLPTNPSLRSPLSRTTAVSPTCHDNLGRNAPCANHVCVLTTPTKTLVGLTSNAYFNSTGLNPLKLFGKNRQSCIGAVGSRNDLFVPCGSDRRTWINTPKQMVIHSSMPITVAYGTDFLSRLHEILDSFVLLVMNFIDRNILLFESIDSAFVSSTQDFSTLYISSQGTKKVYGVLEENIWSATSDQGGLPVSYMFVNYINYQSTPCPTLDKIRGADTQSVCRPSLTAGKRGYQIISIADAHSPGGFLSYWDELTASLRY